MGVVLVAGGANGIGRAAALAFVAQGDDVLLVDHDLRAAQAVIDEAAMTATAAAMTDEGAARGRIRYLIRDLASSDAAGEAVTEAVSAFGGLDCVLTTAALLASMPLAAWTVADWERTMALNLRMPFLLAQAAAPWLARSANPSMIFVSSTGALRGHAGMPAYHASKAGLLGLCRSLADELAPQAIRVNCVLPGWIDTSFNDAFWSYQQAPREAIARIEAAIPMRRQGVPREVADTVLFLASSAARYITGTSLTIDGGYTAV